MAFNEGFEENAVDDKRRFTIPAPYRREFEGHDIMLRKPLPGEEQCILLMTREQGDAYKKREYQKIFARDQRKAAKFLTLWSVITDCPQVDKAWRFIMRTDMMEAADLEASGRAAFVSQGTQIQIWHPARLAEFVDATMAELGSLGAEDDTGFISSAPDPAWLD
ncbi:MAG: hypothetical protein LBR73_00300 [Oscillospiraceae bacterium]|jgi:DNA-binding transcriptional regulator/RsmH inhibitor MraZ|nr:hypothetical protein [Oscillospiraceae bacterium]